MAELSLIVGIIGMIVSVLLFLSPIKTFRRIVHCTSTEGFESLPYICTLLNTALWTYYGVEKTDGQLVAIVNGIGAGLEFVYVALFLVFPPMRAKTATIAAVLDVGVLAGAILITRFMLHGDTRINAIGFLCAGLTIIMYASPLAAVRRVVRSTSVEYMPFLLSFFMLLNGGIWTFYGILVKDLFLGISNGIGCGLGVIQLVLYAKIWRINRNASPFDLPPPAPLIIYEDSEDQSQHQLLT